MVRWLRRAAFGRGADLRRLGRADRLRRRRDIPKRHYCCRSGRRGGDPASVCRSHPGRGRRTGAHGGLDRRSGKRRRGTTRPLSHERRDQNALRGFKEIVGRKQSGLERHKKRSHAVEIPPAGSRPTRRAPKEYFTGTVMQDPIIATAAPARIVSTRVSFEPGARTNWHSHPLGQTLYVMSGVGRVQTKGGPVQEIRPGDVVWSPPGQKTTTGGL